MHKLSTPPPPIMPGRFTPPPFLRCRDAKILHGHTNTAMHETSTHTPSPRTRTQSKQTDMPRQTAALQLTPLELCARLCRQVTWNSCGINFCSAGKTVDGWNTGIQNSEPQEEQWTPPSHCPGENSYVSPSSSTQEIGSIKGGSLELSGEFRLRVALVNSRRALITKDE